MTVIDRDLGYRRLMREPADMRDASVSVGIHADAEDYKAGEYVANGKKRTRQKPETVAEIAMSHEFGLGVPQRSFLRSTVDEHGDKYARIAENGLGKAIDGTGTVAGALDLVGVVVKGDVQVKIEEIREPAHSEATIAKKGSSNPLIDTGHMRQSIDYKVHL